MFETYYEQRAAKDNAVDYKDSTGDNRLYAVCKCKGRVAKDQPECARNPNRELAHRGQGWCLWYMPNGSNHCSHRYPPEDKP